jgi:hypothetical protein
LKTGLLTIYLLTENPRFRQSLGKSWQVLVSLVFPLRLVS